MNEIGACLAGSIVFFIAFTFALQMVYGFHVPQAVLADFFLIRCTGSFGYSPST